MRVLVTGAGGFIASHLVEALIEIGHDVRAMANICGRDTFGWLDNIEGCEKVRGDVRDSHHMRKMVKGMDRVYHLAALGSVPYSLEAPGQFVDTNIFGTMNVALACAEHGAGLVITSTSEVYGNAAAPQDEKTPLQALSPYAASKIGADHLIQSMCAARQLEAVILRPFNTYGPRQSARAVIPRIIQRCMAPKARTIEMGNILPQRDMLYVADTVEAFLSVTPDRDCETYVAATGVSYSIADIATMIFTHMGRDMQIVTASNQERAGSVEVWGLRGDASKLMYAEGWAPEVTLPNGLAMTIDWFVKQGAMLVDGVV